MIVVASFYEFYIFAIKKENEKSYQFTTNTDWMLCKTRKMIAIY